MLVYIITVLVAAGLTDVQAALVAKRLSAQERIFDNLCLEYTIATTQVDHDPIAGDDILVDRTWHTKWAKHGTKRYWEIGELDGHNHSIAWFDGERWYHFDPETGSGQVADFGPAMSNVYPGKYFDRIDGIAISQLIISGILQRQRGDHPETIFVGLHEGTDLRVCIDEDGCVSAVTVAGPKSVRKYVVLETVVDSGTGLALPSHFTLTSEPLGVGNTRTTYVYDAHLKSRSVEESYARELTSSGLPIATIAFNEFKRTYEVFGESQGQILRSWYSRISRGGVFSSGAETRTTASIEQEELARAAEGVCGAVALYGLLMLETHSAPSLTQLVERCVPREDGTTTAPTIVAAAKEQGLELLVVSPQKVAPAVPLILCEVAEDGTGHYAVASPSGDRWLYIDFPRSLKAVSRPESPDRKTIAWIVPNNDSTVQWLEELARTRRKHRMIALAGLGALFLAGYLAWTRRSHATH